MPTKFETARCRRCGRAIVWARTESGAAIPLDPAAPVYRVTLPLMAEGGARAKLAREIVDDEGTRVRGMVSHFATCTASLEQSAPALGGAFQHDRA